MKGYKFEQGHHLYTFITNSEGAFDAGKCPTKSPCQETKWRRARHKSTYQNLLCLMGEKGWLGQVN